MGARRAVPPEQVLRVGRRGFFLPLFRRGCGCSGASSSSLRLLGPFLRGHDSSLPNSFDQNASDTENVVLSNRTRHVRSE
jgi:hypothetical protein